MKSMSRVRSCTSSMITQPTPFSAGSSCSRRNKIPDVMKIIRVLGPTTLSNRTWYPTSCPTSCPLSSATREATPTAANRRGCVTMTTGASAGSSPGASTIYWGTCVDLPVPVGPSKTTTRWWATAARISAFDSATGSALRAACRESSSALSTTKSPGTLGIRGGRRPGRTGSSGSSGNDACWSRKCCSAACRAQPWASGSLSRSAWKRSGALRPSGRPEGTSPSSSKARHSNSGASRTENR
mmetsp:Transcript_1046/g.2215  ORF Transcript_1046/g.2215 Transcript_1046/m.2215 type:complete len:241 (-) Transcript_1046:180-902(-)